MTARYGTRAIVAANLVRQSPALARPLAAGCPVAAAEVIYAVRYEMAASVADFIRRRTALSWRHPRCAGAAAEAAARLMAEELGWDRAREQAELKACNPAAPGRRRPARHSRNRRGGAASRQNGVAIVETQSESR